MKIQGHWPLLLWRATLGEISETLSGMSPNYPSERQVWYTIGTGLGHRKLEIYLEKLQVNNQGVITILRFWRFVTSWRQFSSSDVSTRSVNFKLWGESYEIFSAWYDPNYSPEGINKFGRYWKNRHDPTHLWPRATCQTIRRNVKCDTP